MKKTTYKIKMDDGTFNEAEGTIFNKDWGIDKRASSYYVLTYIPNGAFVESSKKMKNLKLMIQEPEFFDFDGTDKTIKGLAEAIQRFRNQNGWE